MAPYDLTASAIGLPLTQKRIWTVHGTDIKRAETNHS